MNLKPALCAFLALNAAAFAAPRIWTSADGRTIEADYLGRSADGSALVLTRADTKARVTVPLASLSAEDQAHAETLGKAAAPADPATVAADAAAKKKASLESLAKSWPEPKVNQAQMPYWNIGHADYVELRRVYGRDMAAITSGDVAMNCRSLRTKAERDLKRLDSEGATSFQSSTQGLAKAGAAQLGAHWIRTCVLPHLAKIEAEAAK